MLPGSEQILTQSNEFNRSIDQLGDRVNVVHIITGEDARMTDVTSLSAATNATWNVYLDEKGVFAKSLPTGASDAVSHTLIRATRVSRKARPIPAWCARAR